MGKFHSIICILSMLIGASGFAETLPRDHFHYPADVEIPHLLGVDDVFGVKFTKKILTRCASGAELSDEADRCLVGNSITNNAVPADAFPLADLDARFVFFGEVHLGQEIKTYLAKHMQALRDQGITVLAMEMFNVESQPVLDRYLRDEASIQEVEKALISGWTYEPAGYLAVVVAAKKAGMQILAIDDRNHIHMPGNAFPGEYGARDLHMAAMLTDAARKDPSAKFAVYCGQMHAYKIFSRENRIRSLPAILRDEFGYTTKSVIAYYKLDPAIYNTMYTAAYGNDSSAIVKMREEYAYADYMLFLRNYQ